MMVRAATAAGIGYAKIASLGQGSGERRLLLHGGDNPGKGSPRRRAREARVQVAPRSKKPSAAVKNG